MKRVYGTLGIGVVLVWGLVFFMTGTLLVQAQINPNAPAAPNTVYLPLIVTPKRKIGIHLGNRSSDWQPAFLEHIQPPPPRSTTDGHWPAAVVIQSNQVYDFSRDTSGQCWVNGATVKQNNQKDYAIYDYLTRAISRIDGTIVVIRLAPSPGNFSDYDHPGGKHKLLATETPAGGNYCQPRQSGELSQADKVKKYRDIHDLAAEIAAIYQVNKAHGWPTDRFYFEPANEPNYEWYEKLVEEDEVKDLAPNVDNKQAWIEMDDYFAALYDLVKQLYPKYDLRLLSPSITQELHGEHYALGTCDSTGRIVFEGNGRTGLDFMKFIYGYDIWTNKSTTPKADGFSLHNYWRYSHEAWDQAEGGGGSLDIDCKNNSGYTSPSDHIFQYYSDGMVLSMWMSGKPIFITEADIQSWPCQEAESPIISKDRIIDPNHPESAQIDFPGQVVNSLNKFIREEYGAHYVIAWVLVNQFEDAGPCGNTEINWHEAYGENGNEREWFDRWWPTTR